MVSRLYYYNFGKAGKDEADHKVSGKNYKNTILASVIFTRMQNMVLQNGQTLLRQQKNSMEKEKNQLLYLVKISR